MDDEILTLEEAAGLLKVDPAIVLQLLQSSELAGRSIGGEWRTTKRALVCFVDGAPLQMSCCPSDMCCAPGDVVSGAGGALRRCCS